MSTEPILIGSKLSENVACTGCTKEIPVADAYCFRDKKKQDVYYCANCKQKVDAAYVVETENPNIPRAVIMGLLAGIIAGAVWFAVEAIFKIQLGYIALGAGYLVGNAVVWGSGKKRGTKLQIISAAITLVSIVGASYFSTIYAVNKYIAEELSKQGETASGYLWFSPLNPDILANIISPMILIIWGIGLYIAFRVPQPRKI
jgi:uncharacterized membrane protein YbjE (DUF340 family)